MKVIVYIWAVSIWMLLFTFEQFPYEFYCLHLSSFHMNFIVCIWAVSIWILLFTFEQFPYEFYCLHLSSFHMNVIVYIWAVSIPLSAITKRSTQIANYQPVKRVFNKMSTITCNWILKYLPFSDIDDCAGVTCQHGGYCTDNIGSYTCSCTSGFTGAHCETGKQHKSTM